MLSAENFKTTVNYPMILALVGFFAIASAYMKDHSLFSWIVSTEPILTYLGTTRGYVNTLTYI